MADDKKDKPKLKDLSAFKTTDALMEGFVKLSAEVENTLWKQAFKELDFAEPTEKALAKKAEDRKEELLTRMKAQREAVVKKFGKDEGETKFRTAVEGIYRQMEKVQNEPDAYKKELEKLKKELLKSKENNPDMTSDELLAATDRSSARDMLVAYGRAQDATSDVLWKGDTAHAQSLPAQVRQDSKVLAV